MKGQIYTRVSNLINTLASCKITLDNGKVIDLVNDLKSTPRTGKAVRMDKHNLNLPKRSIYDHVLSLAYQADVYADILNIHFDIDKTVQLIAFHDLSESVSGDIPEYTAKSLFRNNSSEEKRASEKIASEIILHNLPYHLKESYSSTIRLLNNDSDNTTKMFLMVDKSDPIIAIWRYISLFRKEVEPSSFLKAMEDFFENPKVISYCVNEEVKQFVIFLQNPKNALTFFKEDQSYFDNLQKDWLSKLTLSLIENRKMNFITI